jgi:hypothetical protein
MSISRSRDCIHSSRSGHSSSPSRTLADCPSYRCWAGVGRVVDRWMGSSLARRPAGPGWRARYCSVHCLAARGRCEAPSIPENFMKKLNRRAPPPWGDDAEEALRAQYEALQRQAVLSPSGRSSRSRLIFKLGVIISLPLIWLLYALLSRHF